MTNITEKPAPKRPRRMAREPQGDASQQQDAGTNAAAKSAASPPKQTKASMVLDLLSRPKGATLDQMVAATGWLPHTTRAALTGLKKKGHTIVRRKIEGQATYFRV